MYFTFWDKLLGTQDPDDENEFHVEKMRHTSKLGDARLVVKVALKIEREIARYKPLIINDTD
ncbi:MAG: hypothetical protein N2235_04245 [Fischerella sp.]|nr:hypothetical protein [Fischerella sp.]